MMKAMLEIMKARRGQGMTEYAVIVALVVGIAILVMGTNGTLGTAISGLFGEIATAVNGVNP